MVFIVILFDLSSKNIFSLSTYIIYLSIHTIPILESIGIFIFIVIIIILCLLYIECVKIQKKKGEREKKNKPFSDMP